MPPHLCLLELLAGAHGAACLVDGACSRAAEIGDQWVVAEPAAGVGDDWRVAGEKSGAAAAAAAPDPQPVDVDPAGLIAAEEGHAHAPQKRSLVKNSGGGEGDQQRRANPGHNQMPDLGMQEAGAAQT
mmetsp:Transcript_8198/g.21876  ORF Transcript_8198/g.21876 Transcript_8198/m.21876 type:complete len:128 (+) Transcript_8198:842-1225(+)